MGIIVPLEIEISVGMKGVMAYRQSEPAFEVVQPWPR